MRFIIYQLIAIIVLSIFITIQLIQLAFVDDKIRVMPMTKQTISQNLDNASVLSKNVGVIEPIRLLNLSNATTSSNYLPIVITENVNLGLNKLNDVSKEADNIKLAINKTDSENYCFIYNFTTAEGLK